MKKRLLTITLVLLLAIIAVGAAACVQRDADGKIKPDKPTGLTVFGDTLSWDAVDNAAEYYVSIDGAVSSPVKGLSYTLDLAQGAHVLKVRAQGDGDKYGEGDWSDELNYVKKVSLSRPVVTLTGNVASWAAVDNAIDYTIKVTKSVDDKESEVETLAGVSQLSFTFEGDKYAANGVYVLRVVANAAQDSEYSSSAASAEVRYVNGNKLETPAFSSMSSGTLRWSGITNAQGYEIRYNVKGSDDYKTYSPSGKATSLSLSVLNLAGGEYEFCIRAKGNGVNYFDSDYSEKSEDYTVRKLPIVDQSGVTLETSSETISGTSITLDKKSLKVDLSALDLTGVKNIVVTLNTKKADGTTSLSPVSKSIAIAEAEKESKTAYVKLDDLFYTIKDGVFTPEYSKDSEKGIYGRNYTISIQLTGEASATKVISSDVLKLENAEYRSYKIPTSDNGWYQISDIGELAFMLIAARDAKFKLTADIDCAGYDFDTIARFNGQIDGDGHHIDNLVLGSVEQEGKVYAGLIGELQSNGHIINLHLNNPKFNVAGAADYAGAIAAYNAGTITNCSVIGGKIMTDEYTDADTLKPFVYAGGISGYSVGTIEYCQSSADVYGQIAGGVVGAVDKGLVNYSAGLGAVYAQRPQRDGEQAKTSYTVRAGGLIGKISQVSVAGQISVSYSYARGAVSLEALTGDDAAAGGLIGEIGTGVKVENSYAGNEYAQYSTTSRVRVAAKGPATAGGFVGRNAGDVVNCYTTELVLSGAVAGGFVGSNEGTIAKSYSTSGTVNNGTTGGFVAVNRGTVSDAFYISDRANETDGAATKSDNIAALASSVLGVAGSNCAAMDGVKNPVIKSMYYATDYKVTVTTRQDISTQVKFVDAEGKTQTINGADQDRFLLFSADNTTAKAGTYIGYFKAANGPKNVVYLLVTVK